MYIYTSDFALPAGALAPGYNPFTDVMTGRKHLHQLRHQELHTATREAMLLIVCMTDHFMDLNCFKTNHALSLRNKQAGNHANGMQCGSLKASHRP